MRNQTPYHAFLLKLWPVASKARVLWRVILENPHSGERHGFKDLEGLMDFLKEIIHEGDDSPHREQHRSRDQH